ncbi:hypothetical protein [Fluctibacter corallii]
MDDNYVEQYLEHLAVKANVPPRT